MNGDFFFSSRRRHTRFKCDWSSDVCSSDLVSTQLTGANMRTVETPSAAGTGWRGSLSRLYRMIEALETSPMESLYDRVLRLDPEGSALKRNLPIGSVGHEGVELAEDV